VGEDGLGGLRWGSVDRFTLVGSWLYGLCFRVYSGACGYGLIWLRFCR